MWSRILGPWTTAAVLTVVVANGLRVHDVRSILFWLYLAGGAALVATVVAYRRRMSSFVFVGAVAVVFAFAAVAFLEHREGLSMPRGFFLGALFFTWCAAGLTKELIVEFRTRPAGDWYRLGGPEAATVAAVVPWPMAYLGWAFFVDYSGNELIDGPTAVFAVPAAVLAIALTCWAVVGVITWFCVPRWLMWLSPPARRAALLRAGRRRGAKRRLARAEMVLADLRRDIRAATDAHDRRTEPGPESATGSAADGLSGR